MLYNINKILNVISSIIPSIILLLYFLSILQFIFNIPLMNDNFLQWLIIFPSHKYLWFWILGSNVFFSKLEKHILVFSFSVENHSQLESTVHVELMNVP